MQILAELTGTVAVTEDEHAYVLGSVEVTDDAPYQVILTVTNAAAVAYAQRYQQLGAGIVINGLAMPDREIGNVLTITESADSYGDRAAFQLIGSRFSPFAREYLRTKALVEISLVIGNVANEFRKKVFTGYFVETPYDGQPPAANVICLDAAALYAQKRAKTWTLPSNSNRARVSIINELLALVGIPAGHFDLVGDGGRVNKPLAPGDQPILDFIRDLCMVRGADVGMENGRICGRRYSPDLPPVIEFNASNLLVPWGLTVPDTLSPNVTGVVAVSYSQEPVAGYRTPPATSVITIGPYAPVTALGYPSWPEANRIISEVIARETYLGDLVVRSDTEEWGWYAARAAGEKIQSIVDDPGWEVAAHSDFPTYEFPDGSTRGEAAERFRRISKTVVTKDVDANMNVIAVHEAKYNLHFLRKAIWQVGIDGENALVTDPGGVYINDDGQGVQGGREVMGLVSAGGTTMEGGLPSSPAYTRPDELTDTVYELAADGTIKTETVTHHYYDVGAPMRKKSGAYGYGFDEVTYSSRPEEARTSVPDQWGGLRVTTRRYRVIDESRYELIERTTGGNESPRTVRSELAGSPPRPESAQPVTSSQEIRYVIEDRARIAQVGEEIEDIQVNEFVETPEDARLLAEYLARTNGAITLTCAVAIESLAHKYRMALVNLPGSSIDGKRFYIKGVTRNAATYREDIVAEFYPALS